MITTLFLGFVTLRGKGLRVTKGDPDQYLPTSVQKSYFMVSLTLTKESFRNCSAPGDDGDGYRI
jgi:hypothetical protein